MWDQSGSMSARTDSSYQNILDALTAGVVGRGDVKRDFTDAANKSERRQSYIVFEGSPGTGKSTILKELNKLLDGEKFQKDLNENKKDIMFIDTMNKQQHDLKLDPALLKRMQSIVLPPLTEETQRRLVDHEIDKSGITGEHRDITRETAHEAIRRGDAQARRLLPWVRELIADPQHPDLEIARQRRVEAARQAAAEQHLNNSRRQGSALAGILQSGASSPIRPLRPIGFRKP